AAALAWTVALLAFLIAATFAGLYIRRPVVDAPSVRFTLSPPDGTVVSLETAFGGAARIPIAISPDGRQLALVATDASGHVRLWVRRLDALAARELPGTDNAASPFWSPDSRWIAYFADGRLRKIDVNGGLPVVLCSLPSFNAGTWGTSGVIVIALAGGGG